MTSFSNTEGATFKNYHFASDLSGSTIPDKKNDDTVIDFFVKAPPNEMEGIEGLWKIAMDCQDALVGKKVTALLLKLYTDVDFGMEDQIP